jgi:(1->4)-alpha-D-glucan 1-alpha-D-glucosylmutase
MGEVLRGRIEGPGRELCRRFQQLSSPVMAKGVEDTAFYRSSRLLALNEVGGDPDRIGGTPEAFHRWMSSEADRWPASMLAGSTHDTKRSEDVRARLALLAEIPDELGAVTRRWRDMNAHLGLDDPDLEYALYQSLIGAHPLPAERAVAFAHKAAREAKIHTSWNRPDEEFEKTLQGFVEGVTGDPDFLAELDAFVAPLIEPGRTNSLAMQLVRLLAPGVPDIYQGTELWDLSLVDPDNRRPVDFELRARLLDELDGLDVEAVLARADEGLPKLLVTRAALAVRRPGLGAYQPLADADQHVLGFLRGDSVAVIVPRLPIRLARDGGWGDRTITLPPGPWLHRLSGRTVDGGEVGLVSLFGHFPVALLTAVGTA